MTEFVSFRDIVHIAVVIRLYKNIYYCVADRSLPPTYPISPTFFLLSSCTSHTQLMCLLLCVCLIASEAHQKASWWLTAAEGHKSDIVSKIPYPALAFTLSAMK